MRNLKRQAMTLEQQLELAIKYKERCINGIKDPSFGQDNVDFLWLVGAGDWAAEEAIIREKLEKGER